MSAIRYESRYVQTGDIRIRFLEWPGPSQESPALLLLHGLTSCAETWSFIAPLLTQRFHVYALDLRGHGETDKPDHGYDFHTISADVAALLEGVGIERAVLAGHSWGASVAACLAASRGDLVSHLIMVDGGFFSPRRRAGMTLERWESMLAPEEIYATRETYLAAASHSLGHLTPELEEIFMASVYMNGDGSVREKLGRENQVRILRAMWDYHPEDIYARIKCPALLVPARSGDPEMARFVQAKEEGIAEVQKLMPQAKVVWIEDSVHDLQLQRPKELAEAVLEFVGGE